MCCLSYSCVLCVLWSTMYENSISLYVLNCEGLLISLWSMFFFQRFELVTFYPQVNCCRPLCCQNHPKYSRCVMGVIYDRHPVQRWATISHRDLSLLYIPRFWVPGSVNDHQQRGSVVFDSSSFRWWLSKVTLATGRFQSNSLCGCL